MTEVQELQEKIKTAAKTPSTVKFFFYGIFLSKVTRHGYGIKAEPRYATVQNYVTVGHDIVQAVPVDPKIGAALTGIVVDVPASSIGDIDLLETGYNRETIKTVRGETVQMYVSK